MNKRLRKAWEEVVRPLVRRPDGVQVAALCTRPTKRGDEVLLITSRGSGRWIVPKGWPIDGLDGPESALREAWEEAGVRKANVWQDPVGRYSYDKVLDDGSSQTVRTSVYRLLVDSLSDEYPEAHERKRKWMSPADAANRVNEPELQAILRQL